MNRFRYFNIKLEEHQLVWFIESERFVLLKKPAFKLLQMITQESDFLKTISYCETQFLLNKTDAQLFIKSFINSIEKLKETKQTLVSPKPKLEKKPVYSSIKEKSKTYLFFNKEITIEYGQPEIKQLFDPLFEHLEIKSIKKSNHTISLFQSSSIYYIFTNNIRHSCFQKKDIPYFKGTVFKIIYSLMYNFQESDWIMTMHSSGVVQNNKTYLFAGPGGSGKSTLAAFLNTKTFSCISDDFVAIDKNGKAYPFPAAISIKEGAFSTLKKSIDEFPNLKLHQYSNYKKVKMYPFKNEKLNIGNKINAIFLLNFNNLNRNQITKDESKNAIETIFRESWINPKEETIRHFLRFIQQIPIYRLHYSSSQNAYLLLSDFISKK